MNSMRLEPGSMGKKGERACGKEESAQSLTFSNTTFHLSRIHAAPPCQNGMPEHHKNHKACMERLTVNRHGYPSSVPAC
jgi:hypothetical protein